MLAGWSWGGYITLLGAGAAPGPLVLAGIAGVPVADYVAAYEDESPILQALDRALFGGVARGRAGPVPGAQPDHVRGRASRPRCSSSRARTTRRCPIRQVWNYVGRLRERGVEPEVYTYATGHASFDIEERVRQTAIVLDFLAATVPGARRLENLDVHLDAAGMAVAAPG